MKKNFLVFLGLLFIFAIILFTFSASPVTAPIEISRVSISPLSYKKLTFNFTYQPVYPEMKITNLHLPGKVGKFGVDGDVAKFARALRFKNITDAVEDRYNLPPGIVFAMMVKESNGIDLLPNGLGDGGFGLSHMQPLVASDFGLKTYENCRAMVCNGRDKRSCKINGQYANHAKALMDCIIKYNYDRKKVISCDDRLHPIKNLDAVGRMLASFMDGPQIKNLGPLPTAICRYAGKYHYEAYWQDVRGYMKLLTDTTFLRKVADVFNTLNPALEINNAHADFKMYIAYFQQQNFNYGLKEYCALPKYQPRNSEIVLQTYKNLK